MQIQQAYLDAQDGLVRSSNWLYFHGDRFRWNLIDPTKILQTEKISTALPSVFLEESLISLQQLKDSQGTFTSESILTFTATTISGQNWFPKCSHNGKVTGYCLGGYQ